MFKMDPATLRATLEELEKATRDHADWHAHVMRTIVCRVPCDADDLAEDAHRRCRFGQWYYGTIPVELRAQPTFVSLEAEHRRVHGLAARLLRQVTDAAAIDHADYDAFVAISAKVRLELASLRHEIQGALRSSDVLTGAYGRAEVLPELREWRELARRGVAQCCIVFMDLDHFKEINDRYGHQVGDEVLAGAVRGLSQHLRPYDKVFRYGGDEFLIALPGADLAIGQTVIKRVREGLAGTALVVDPDGIALHTTASFGLALLDPEVSVEDCIERADQALLLAKAAGRNRAINWDAALTTSTRLRRLQLDDAPE